MADIEKVTCHHEKARNKVHRFREIYNLTQDLIDLGYATGYTECGHMTYVPLLPPKPFHIKCKKCFVSGKRSIETLTGQNRPGY